ncbi:xyloglucan fucosyltransferase [Marchantia polymorpha subsp. ruderalis]
MELPRSRRSAHSPLGRKSDSAHTHTPVADEKGSRLPVLLSSVLLLALGGTLLYTTSFSLNCGDQLEQSLSPSFESDSSAPTIRKVLDGGVLPTSHVLDELKLSDADNTLGGLLADLSEFDSNSCASRAQHLQRKTKFKPSQELVQRLRRYEAQHRKCASRAKDFGQPKSGSRVEVHDSEAPEEDCRYVVWIAYSGLGNRLMTLVSAFLYALLTNRILLVDRSSDMSKLFCEPIPRTSWLVPSEITVEFVQGLNESSPQRFRHGSSTAGDNSSTAEFSYVHLTHTSDSGDEMFFCDSGQQQLDTKPWLFIKSNSYTVPGLFFITQFRADLSVLFPDKEAVFHLLGRYLFHPSDAVWGWITRFHKSYLAHHDQQVGIQIRTFDDSPLPYFLEQIQECVEQHELLPKVVKNVDSIRRSEELQLQNLQASEKDITVLVTSLHPYYYENLRDVYLSGPTEGGESVSVHQPSHEGWQKTNTFGHDLKAWADIYLLSLSDVLLTSGWSTFGYSAQALAGVSPWILPRSTDGQVPNPVCVKARSMEPCFHRPPLLKCKIPEGANPATILPYVQPCEDVKWGIKLITTPPTQVRDHL